MNPIRPKQSATFVKLTVFLTLTACLMLPGSAQATPVVPPEALEQIENSLQTGSAGIATADPDAPHSRYGWPFAVQQVGHLNSSYQLYSNNLNDAYFHHGVDLLAPNGTQVRTPVSGQVVNIENYSSPSELYWEVAILDPEGYVWQYHHIASSSIPSEIHQAYAAYQANPTSGGFIAANSLLGEIVTWPVWSFGYYFHHIHLNILAAGDYYLNPLEFLDGTYTDTQAPQIQSVGLFTGANTLLAGNTIPFGTQYSIYAQTRDLFMSQVYYLPPQRITFKLDGSASSQTVWDFHTLPGGSSDTAYVNQYFLPDKTKGNYDARAFFINLGFTTDGLSPLPIEFGVHEINLEVWDFAYNRATWKYRWVITQSLPDYGCATGQGVSYAYEVTEDAWIEDVNLGVLLAHDARGEVRLSLKGPQDSAPVVLIEPSTDANLNFNLLLDDASSLPINNSKRDDLTPPSYKRIAGPQTDGSLDRYTGLNARGVWQVFVCDTKAGNNGTVHDLDLFITTTADRQPTANPQSVSTPVNEPLEITLTGSDPEGNPIGFEVTVPPAHGSLSGIAPALIYSPASDYIGEDFFQFVVNDGTHSSAPALVNILVLPKIYLPMMISAH